MYTVCLRLVVVHLKIHTRLNGFAVCLHVDAEKHYGGAPNPPPPPTLG